MSGKVGKCKGRMPDERYASFDYCYNYFQSFHERGAERALAEDENVQASCLQVGFYLASWGMLRGAATLLNKSVRHFRGLVQVIANAESRVWDIDVCDYGRKADRELTLGCADKIRGALGKATASDTLVTKIMLGVFGNVPALDQNVKEGLGLWHLNEATLLKILAFYNQHKALLGSHTAISTLDFLSGRETHRRYSMAKLIDMAAFIEGLRRSARVV
jgi:hypothetical protein